MASINGRRRGGVVAVCLLGMLLGASVAYGAAPTITSRDIGVVPDKLLIVDMPYARGTAKVAFVAKDAAITNGSATDMEKIRARLCVEYADRATAGTFVLPTRKVNGWVNNSVTTRYRDRDAPNGRTKMRSILVRPGFLKLRGAGRGDAPLKVARAGPPTGSIYVAFEIVESGITTRLCSEVQHCEYRPFEGGAGATLKCMGGVADPLCRAARPIYVSGEDARYGGPGTVAVIGDSITVQATDALKAALAADRWFTYVRAKSGSMFRHLQPAADKIGESNPQVVVIHLGTNDFGCVIENALAPDHPCEFPDFTSDDLLDDARTMVASVSGACIIGTTTWFGDAVKQLWYDMLATGELAGVVPWEEYLSSLSDEERQVLLRDGIGHLTPAGTVALAAMTTQVVAESCGHTN
jgi:hypothetical protein